MIEIYLDIFECRSIYLHVHVIFSWGIRVTLKYLMEKENKVVVQNAPHKHTLFLSQLTWLNKRYKRLMFFSINLFIMCLSTCREVVVFYHNFISITLQIDTLYMKTSIIHDEVVNISDKYLYFSYLLGEMQLETPLLEPTPELVTIIQIPERMACNSCNMEFQTREDQVLLLWWINNTLCKFKHDTMYWHYILG